MRIGSRDDDICGFWCSQIYDIIYDMISFKLNYKNSILAVIYLNKQVLKPD